MSPPNELQAHLPVSKKYIQLKAPPDTSPPPNVFWIWFIMMLWSLLKNQ